MNLTDNERRVLEALQLIAKQKQVQGQESKISIDELIEHLEADPRIKLTEEK